MNSDSQPMYVYHDESLLETPGAKKAGGIFRSVICLPTSDGSYQAYDEKCDMVGISATNIRSAPTECPRYFKCRGCPERVGKIAVQQNSERTLRLVKDLPEDPEDFFDGGFAGK